MTVPHDIIPTKHTLRKIINVGTGLVIVVAGAILITSRKKSSPQENLRVCYMRAQINVKIPIKYMQERCDFVVFTKTDSSTAPVSNDTTIKVVKPDTARR